MDRSLGTWYFDKRTRKRKYAALNGKVYTGSEGMRMARADAYSPSHPSQLLRAQLMLHVKACNLKYLCTLHAAAATTGSTELCTLGTFGLPPQLLEDYAQSNVSTLFPWQVDCLLSDQGRVLAGEQNLIFSAPTSGGKTLVAEILMLHRLARTMQLGDPHHTPRKTIFFVVPFIALAEEKATHFRNVWKTLNIGIKTFHTQDGNLQSLTAEVEVAILTIERANLLLNQLMLERREQQLTMVVVDEVHLLGDPHRGYLLEVFLSKLRYLADSVQVQIVAMSATLPNLDDLGLWLSASVYRTQTRVTSLETYVCMRGQLVRVEHDQAETDTSSASSSSDGEKAHEGSGTGSGSGSGSGPHRRCTPESGHLTPGREKARLAVPLAADWEGGAVLDDPFYACADLPEDVAGVTAASPTWLTARDMLSSWTYSDPLCATPDASLEAPPAVGPPSPAPAPAPAPVPAATSSGVSPPRLVFHPPASLPPVGAVPDPDHLLAVLAHYLPLTQSLLVFCASKAKCEAACQAVARALSALSALSLQDAHREAAAARGQLVEALALASLGGMHPLIPLCIPHGVFFHHAGLGQEERVLVENAFRKGTLRVLCTTSTLSAGVNLPAQVVILRSLSMGGRPLSVSDFKQMCGRAGRLGCALPARRPPLPRRCSSSSSSSRRRRRRRRRTRGRPGLEEAPVPGLPRAVWRRPCRAAWATPWCCWGPARTRTWRSSDCCLRGSRPPCGPRWARRGARRGGEARGGDLPGDCPPSPSSLVTASLLSPAPAGGRGIERYLLDLVCSQRLGREEDVPAALRASFLAHCLGPQAPDPLATRGREAVRFLKTHQFVCLSASQALRPSPLGVATTQAGLAPADAVAVLPWLLDARRGLVLRSALHLLVVLIPPALLRDGGLTFAAAMPGSPGPLPTAPGDLPWHTFDALLDRLVQHQPATQALLDRFHIRRALVSSFQFHSPSMSFRTSPQCAVYKRVYLACVLWAVTEAASSSALLALIQQHVSRGQLQALLRDCATFAGMIALFCQKLNYHALAAGCEDVAQRLHSGGSRHLLPLLRIGVEVNPHRAKALFDQGITNAREIVLAGVPRLTQIFLRALPYHFRDALTLGPEQPSQGQAWGRPLEAREEKACERLAHSVVHRAEAYLREEMLRRSLLL